MTDDLVERAHHVAEALQAFAAWRKALAGTPPDKKDDLVVRSERQAAAICAELRAEADELLEQLERRNAAMPSLEELMELRRVNLAEALRLLGPAATGALDQLRARFIPEARHRGVDPERLAGFVADLVTEVLAALGANENQRLSARMAVQIVLVSPVPEGEEPPDTEDEG